VKRSFTLELNQEDFIKRVPPLPEGKFFVSTGPDYSFGDKFQTELDKVKAHKPGSFVHFRFENDDGSIWGNLIEGDDFEGDWGLCARADEVFEKEIRLKNGKILKVTDRKSFLAKRGWFKQQIIAAKKLGHNDANLGFFFRYGPLLQNAFGLPTKLVVKYEVLLESV